jgi:ribosomal protein S18 acetylase RimI-like enzyme
MELVIKEVVTKRDLKNFVNLPARIHKGHQNWIPPIYMDEGDFFNPLKNKSFGYCSHIRLLAYRDKELVGRIMGLINHRYNQVKNENNARFSYLETYNDQEVAHALLSKVEDWSKSLGAEKIVGPLGFSDKEPQGYLVEGFDEPTVLAANCNFRYQVDLIKNEGYVPEINLVTYKTAIPDKTPPLYLRMLPRIEKLNSEFKLIEFNSRWKLRKYIRPVLHLTNRAFQQIYGSMPYEEKEMDDFANRFIWLLNPKFIKVIEDKEGKVIAYTVVMPDISKGLQKCKGYLLPFGIFSILRSGKKSHRIVALLGAIEEEYRGRGLDVMMAMKILESGRQEGKSEIDGHLVMETNYAMRGEYEHIGGKVYKRFSIFSKSLK